ncbi:unnamed protein product [Amoebophrya sp. A25]|nr:unnamed protein product [Amoebophrya sp. A25]|eukprot:GSA25T00015661001.1
MDEATASPRRSPSSCDAKKKEVLEDKAARLSKALLRLKTQTDTTLFREGSHMMEEVGSSPSERTVTPRRPRAESGPFTPASTASDATTLPPPLPGGDDPHPGAAKVQLVQSLGGDEQQDLGSLSLLQENEQQTRRQVGEQDQVHASPPGQDARHETPPVVASSGATAAGGSSSVVYPYPFFEQKIPQAPAAGDEGEHHSADSDSAALAGTMSGIATISSKGSVHEKIARRKEHRRLSALRLSQIDNYLETDDGGTDTNDEAAIIRDQEESNHLRGEGSVVLPHLQTGNDEYTYTTHMMNTSVLSSKTPTSSQSKTPTSSQGRTPTSSRTLFFDSEQNVIYESKSRKTLLHFACMNSQERTARYLVQCHQMGLSTQDVNGLTPLHIAVRNGAQGVCRLLLSAFADPNVCTGRKTGGDTPLHLLSGGVVERPLGIARLLLHYGANVNGKNAENLAPLECLMRVKNYPAVDELALLLTSELRRQAEANKQQSRAGSEEQAGREGNITPVASSRFDFFPANGFDGGAPEQTDGNTASNSISSRIWAKLTTFLAG